MQIKIGKHENRGNMNLSELKTGETGIIVKVRGRGAFRNRITEMGFVKGKEVRVIKNAPFNDPIEYEIMDYKISLRRTEAGLVDVVPVCEAQFDKKGHFISCKSIVPEKIVKKTADKKGKIINVALVGNPNCGKTTLFNYLTGSKEKTGNYGGVTVSAKMGKYKLDGYTFNMVDLPGTYALSAYSPEELFVRKHLFEDTPDVVINILDSGNLERNLYLTSQLIDMDMKVVAALNIFDELEKKGDTFDTDTIGLLMGLPFVPTVGSKGKGIEELFHKVIEVFENREKTIRHIHIDYGDDVEKSIKQIQEKIFTAENYLLTDVLSSRFLSIKLLEKDKDIEKRIIDNTKNGLDILVEAKKQIEHLEKHLMEDSEILITDARYGFISGALMETYFPAKRPSKTKSEKIDLILTNRIFGFPLFIFFMWITFQLTFSVGEYPMTWISGLVKSFSDYISFVMQDGLLKDLIADGIITGVGGVVVFLPNILMLFFMISLMEDTGYMARASFIMDKVMHKIGLHGKSFIPLIMGFGCNVPAIMATRTLASRNDRILTMLIIPFMSCSARLPVYVLFITAFFSSHAALVLFLIYLTGISVAIITALFLKKAVFSSNELPFVMELPPYRLPHLKTTLSHMWEKGVEYLKKIAGVILTVSIIIWALGKFPSDIEYSVDYDKKTAEISSMYGNKIKIEKSEDAAKKLEAEKAAKLAQVETEKEAERLRKSYIGKLGQFIEPAIRPLGFDWKMGVSLISGLAAKETVVSTMGILYNAEKEGDKSRLSLVARLKDDPGFSPLKAFAFMIFILTYFPCMAAIATIRRETGSWRWAGFAIFYTLVVAWLLAFLVYNIGGLIL